MKYPTEHAEQVCFVNWFRKTFPDVLIFSIPNGSFRHKATAQKLKMEGVTKGVPDLFIPEWNLWVEMKRVKGGTVSKEQKEMIKYLNRIGHKAAVCKGHKEAMEWIVTHTTSAG